MSTAAVEEPLSFQEPLSFDEFLALEEVAERKYEYVDGYVYALAGAWRRHNDVAASIFLRLGQEAVGHGCRIYGSDMLLKAASAVGEVGYYPDVHVVCDRTDLHERYSERPCIIVEVLSDSTKRIDRGEKLLAYTRIASLEAYLIVSQDQRRVERHWRDGDEWQLELIVGEGVIPLPCIGGELSLDDIYGRATEG